MATYIGYSTVPQLIPINIINRGLSSVSAHLLNRLGDGC